VHITCFGDASSPSTVLAGFLFLPNKNYRTVKVTLWFYLIETLKTNEQSCPQARQFLHLALQ
jgi:hypothetical protein